MVEEIHYKPGSCNIGSDEIKRRYNVGYSGIALIIVFILFVELLHLPRVYRIGIFIPAFYAFSGFVQGYNKFCFVYGWKGIASFRGRRKFISITDEMNLRRDRKNAIRIVVIVTICSTMLTALYFIFPF